MKKVIFLLIMIITVTGCSIQKIDRTSYIATINQVINTSKKLHNETGNGYKYYLPKGISLYDSSDTNQILHYNNSKMYMYVDVVSYYDHIGSEFTKDNSIYYSEEIKNGDKFGYISIIKYNNGYFVEEMYNYAKIECFVKLEDLSNTLINITSILNSITYNDSVISSFIGESGYNYKEEIYNIFTPTEDVDNYLNFEEDIYNDYTGEIKDEDSIIIDDDQE